MQGLGEGGMGGDFLNKYRVSFGGDEAILDLDRSDGCIILQIRRLMQDSDSTRLRIPAPLTSMLKWHSERWFRLLTSQSNSVSMKTIWDKFYY